MEEEHLYIKDTFEQQSHSISQPASQPAPNSSKMDQQQPPLPLERFPSPPPPPPSHSPDDEEEEEHSKMEDFERSHPSPPSEYYNENLKKTEQQQLQMEDRLLLEQQRTQQQQQQLQQQQQEEDDEGYFSEELEEGEIRERRPSPIIFDLKNDEEDSGKNRKSKRRRRRTMRSSNGIQKRTTTTTTSCPYKFEHIINYVYNNNGYWHNPDVYKVVRYQPERIKFLVGKFHRTHNYLEKKYGVQLQIPSDPYHSSLDIICSSTVMDNNQGRICESLREIYPMLL